MSYNAKNYTQQGGEKTVIGGEIVIEGKLSVASGAEVTGIIPSAENQADSEASTIATLKDDFNDLLAKLKTAGLMEADAEASEETGE